MLEDSLENLDYFTSARRVDLALGSYRLYTLLDREGRSQGDLSVLLAALMVCVVGAARVIGHDMSGGHVLTYGL